MNAIDYKKAVQEDVQRLKTITIDVLPAIRFYRKIAHMMAWLFIISVASPWALNLFINKNHYSLSFYLTDLIVLCTLFLFIAFLFLPQAAQYVTFKETIKPHLVLGELIDKQFKLYFKIFTVVSVLWSTLYTVCFFNLDFSHWGERLFTLVPGVLIGVFSASLVFQMEIARVGASTLFEIIGGFKKDQRRHLKK